MDKKPAMILIRGKVFLLLTAFIAGFSYLSYSEDKRCLSEFSDIRKDRLLNDKKSRGQNRKGVEFKELRSKMLQLDGSIKEIVTVIVTRPALKKPDGYAKFVEEYYSNNMDLVKTFKGLLAIPGVKVDYPAFLEDILDKKEMEEMMVMKLLEQTRYKMKESLIHGELVDLIMYEQTRHKMKESLTNEGIMAMIMVRTYHPRKRESGILLKADGSIKKKYRGIKGYLRFFAEDSYLNDIQKVYKDLSVDLDKKQIPEKLKREILSFLLEHFFNQMQETYRDVSAGLNEKQMKELDWSRDNFRVVALILSSS